MPNRSSYLTYTVVSGDTLAKIAKRYASTVQAIAQASGVADPNKIQVGQELLIPVAAGSVPPPIVTSAPKMAPQSIPQGDAQPTGEQAMIDWANTLADWLKPPKLYFTLALALGAGYFLLADNPRSKRR